MCVSYRMAMYRDFVFVVGPPGSGKTSLVRQFVNLGKGVAKASEKGMVAWVQNENRVVFGRWQGFHDDEKSTLAGRLDGCDRLWNGAPNIVVSLLPTLIEEGVHLFVADGATLATPKVVECIESLGITVHFLYVYIEPTLALERWILRDGDLRKPEKIKGWQKVEKLWSSHESWSRKSPEKVLEFLIEIDQRKVG